MAQLVEQLIRNQQVTGSSPVTSSKNKDTMKVVSLFLCLCPQDTTSFFAERRHHSAIADTKRGCASRKQCCALHKRCFTLRCKRCFDFVKNDVVLCTNVGFGI